jgi:cellobiose phosphorylase
MVARAALLAGRWATFDRAFAWVVDASRPTWTPFEHFDFAAPDKTNRRWYRGGIIPWLAYAEPSMLVVNDLLGYHPGLSSITLRPSLPPSVRRVKATLRYRGRALELDIVNGKGPLSSVRVDGLPLAHEAASVQLRPLDGDISVKLVYGEKA